MSRVPFMMTSSNMTSYLLFVTYFSFSSYKLRYLTNGLCIKRFFWDFLSISWVPAVYQRCMKCHPMRKHLNINQLFHFSRHFQSKKFHKKSKILTSRNISKIYFACDPVTIARNVILIVTVLWTMLGIRILDFQVLGFRGVLIGWIGMICG